MALPQTKNPDNGDLETPFDWYPHSSLYSLNLDLRLRNELNILLGLVPKEGDPEQAIKLIHSTSRWLRGRAEETFWDQEHDSREWDEYGDDTRRATVKDYDPRKWGASRYSLPMEIRVKLGIQYLLAKNFSEAMVLHLLFLRILHIVLEFSQIPKLSGFMIDSIQVPRERKSGDVY
jgi:hypothetical protein